MITLLKREQPHDDDNDKKEMCEMQLDEAKDKLTVLETTISNLEKSLADGKEGIAIWTDVIAALTAGLAEIDKQVEEAMANRKGLRSHRLWTSVTRRCTRRSLPQLAISTSSPSST